MQAWIGPAVIAAIISSVVGAVGWYATYRNTVALDRYRRTERVRDLQVASRAEIRSELHDLQSHDRDIQLAQVRERYDSRIGYQVLVPSPVRHIVYETFVADLHILPESVIDAIVLYYRQRDTIEKLVGNMSETRFRDRDVPQQLEIYKDYLDLRTYLRDLAVNALDAIEDSLNSRAAVPSVPKSVGGPTGD